MENHKGPGILQSINSRPGEPGHIRKEGRQRMPKLTPEEEATLKRITDKYKQMDAEDKKAFTNILDAAALLSRIKEVN